jgi:hypothetical protein
MIELPAMSAFEQVRAEAYPGRELAAIPGGLNRSVQHHLI